MSEASLIVGPVGAQEEELALHAGLELEAGLGRLGDHLLEDVARGLLDQLAVHVGIGGEPADLGLPRHLDQACWDREWRGRRGRRASCRASWRSRRKPAPSLAMSAIAAAGASLALSVPNKST